MTGKTLRGFVGELTTERLWEVADSYSQFERDGMIGEEPIRIEARRYLEEIGHPSPGMAMWMNTFAFEVWRELALRAATVTRGLTPVKTGV